MTDLSDLTVIVTGAGRGLGRSHALMLASIGANVVVNDAGRALDGSADTETAGARTVAEIVAAGGHATCSDHDVTDVEAVEAMFHEAVSAFGRVDAVINNAGFVRDRSLGKMTDEEIGSVLDVHLLGSMIVARAAVQRFRDHGGGRLVFTTSGAGLYGNAGQANYGAAKMGVVGLTKVLAQEGRKHGILANAVAPAARTRMTESLELGRIGDHIASEQVSPLFAYLCSPACETTGEVYECGGGQHRRVVIGATRGWFAGIDAVPSLDDIAANWTQINDPTSLTFPTGAIDANRSLFGPLLQELRR